jgi:rhamnogalacturonan endolyase
VKLCVTKKPGIQTLPLNLKQTHKFQNGQSKNSDMNQPKLFRIFVTNPVLLNHFVCKAFLIVVFGALSLECQAQRQMESLDHGLVAVKVSNGVFLSWRITGNEFADTSYNLYRESSLIATVSNTGASNFTDGAGTINSTYTVRSVVNGIEGTASNVVTVLPDFYKIINLQKPADGITPTGETYQYSPNDCSVGDLNGDGQYEIVVKWDPSNSKDNSQSGYTGNVYLDAYTLSGAFLWRIDLGKNIRAGAHYTQFMVFDLDGDGFAEIACKTAPGTKDGSGEFLSKGPAASDNDNADYRNTAGYILSGPEYFTIFDGRKGKELTTTSYLPARGAVTSWGDDYGNRVDRFLACVAYLDGTRPSVVMCRGYYTRTVLVAWDWRDGVLTQRWTFDSNAGYPTYAGKGNHNLSVGDVDDDGKDEIVYGNVCIDDNGKGLWAESDFGHGDAMHLADIDPSRPGLEKWGIMENSKIAGSALLDAKTGEVLWKSAPGDVGRGCAGDLSADFPGMEVWGGTDGLRSATNASAGGTPTSTNFVTWWDGDELREVTTGTKLDKYGGGRLVTFYNYESAASCNGTKDTPNLQADIFGDWREEYILHSGDNTKLLIFTTNIPTNRRMYSLMHDKMYRLGVAWQNVAYNQPPHLSFFFGNGMAKPPIPDIKLVTPKIDYTFNSRDNLPQLTSKASVTNGILRIENDPENFSTILMADLYGRLLFNKTVRGNYNIQLSSIASDGNNIVVVKQGKKTILKHLISINQ